MRSPALPQSDQTTRQPTSLSLWMSRISWLLLGFGLVIRVLQYLSNRALWADEAKLALNLVNRSYGELLQPLAHDQIAPVGFLWAEKAAIQLLGQTEYALRLVPLVSGIVSLGLFYLLLRGLLDGTLPSAAPVFTRSDLDSLDSKDKVECSRAFIHSLTLSPIALPIALALFVCLHDLVYYASEVKQYSSDVAIALLLTVLLLRVRQPKLGRRQVLVVTLAGAIALWCSHPAVFVLTGVELSYAGPALVQAWRNRQRNVSHLTHRGLVMHWRKRLLMYGGWGLSFAAFYGLTLYNHPTEGTLTTSWDYTFPESWLDLDWLFYALKRFFRNPLRFPDVVDEVAIALFVLGCVALARRSMGRLGVLVAPVGVTLVAAYLQKYPFRDRLVLFLVPFFMVMLAIGVAYSWDILQFRRSCALGTKASSPDASNVDASPSAWQKIRHNLGRAFNVALIAILLSIPLWRASQFLMSSYAFEDIRPLMEYVQTYRQAGDRLYVFQKSQYQFEFYAPRYDFQSEDYVISVDPDRVGERDFSAAKRAAYRQDVRQFEGERVWFLVADTSLRDDTEFLVSMFESIGQRRDCLETDYAASFVCLYDLT